MIVPAFNIELGHIVLTIKKSHLTIANSVTYTYKISPGYIPSKSTTTGDVTTRSAI